VELAGTHAQHVNLLTLLCIEVATAPSPSYCGAIDYSSSPQLAATRL
jgi:hypothetical protein